MTRDDIIRIAREAWLCDGDGRDSDSIVITSYLEHFAKLVAAAEREKIAQIIKDSPPLVAATIQERGKP